MQIHKLNYDIKTLALIAFYHKFEFRYLCIRIKSILFLGLIKKFNISSFYYVFEFY